jgi:hypothetical protein
MEGVDALGHPVSIIIYENLFVHYVRNTPIVGDCFVCKHLHHSVYVPVMKICFEHVWLRSLSIDNDVLDHYFPIHEMCNHNLKELPSVNRAIGNASFLASMMKFAKCPTVAQ